jgi:hypothetical protein
MGFDDGGDFRGGERGRASDAATSEADGVSTNFEVQLGFSFGDTAASEANGISANLKV